MDWAHNNSSFGKCEFMFIYSVIAFNCFVIRCNRGAMVRKCTTTIFVYKRISYILFTVLYNKIKVALIVNFRHTMILTTSDLNHTCRSLNRRNYFLSNSSPNSLNCSSQSMSQFNRIDTSLSRLLDNV